MKKKYFLLAFLLLFSKINFASTVLVQVEDFEFDPAIITVNVGDTIMWIYDSGVHTTTSVLIPSGAAPWDAGIDQSNPMFMYVITVQGSYDYQCSYHASMGMVGHITALDPTSVPVLTDKGDGLDYNFTSDKLSFTFANSGSWRIGVFDIKGAEARSFGYVSSGNSYVEFSVADLPQGVYIVKMTDGISSLSGKLIKE